MIVNCEECGTRYRLNEDLITGRSAKAKCKVCGHVMRIFKPGYAEQPSFEGLSERQESAPSGTGAAPTAGERTSGGSEEAAAPSGAQASGTGGGAYSSPPTAARRRGRGLGIRGKMFFLFVITPIALMIAASFLYVRQLEHLQSLSTERSLEVVQETAVTQISQKARDVSRQIQIYLSANPDLEAGDFMRDPTLRSLAVQKIGEAGFTFLYGPQQQEDEPSVLVHFSRDSMGTAISELSGRTARFNEILQQAAEGEGAGGYYKDYTSSEQGTEKYIYCAPVEGTDYVLAATSEVAPLIRPARVIQTRVYQIYQEVRTQVLIGLGVLIAVIFILVTWFGYRMSKRISYLSDVAERISVGDLAAEIQVKGKDEIAMLADSISRMQQSVRLSIERLRKRR